MKLEELIGGSIGESVARIVGAFKLSPEVQAQLTKQAEENKFEIQKIASEQEQHLADTAAANIQSEEKSGDKYTSRARPTFLYIMEFILAWNYVAVPLFKQAPVTLPEPLFWLFGSCMLGYTGARTWEKLQSIKTGA